MDINISETSKEETEKFESSAWESVDMEHWGKNVDWVVKNFYFKATDANNNIVGTLLGKYESGVTYVDNLVVGKDIRGSGVGTQLMKFIENWTLENGGHKVFLLTREEWDAAKFYTKLGYSIEAKLEKHFLNKDFVVFRKFL